MPAVRINGVKTSCIVMQPDPIKIADWDFTSESLVDSVNGYTIENHNATLSSNGLSFNTNSCYVDIPLDLLGIGRAYEIEFGEMDCEYSENNNRLFGYRYYSNTSQSYSNNGLYYRGAASLWCVYDDTNGVQASNISDPDYFSNSTMKIEIGTDGKWKIYKNGELVFAPPLALPITPRIFNLGSYQYPFYNMVIKKFRIYELQRGGGEETKIDKIIELTETDYNALATKDPNTLYNVLTDSEALIKYSCLGSNRIVNNPNISQYEFWYENLFYAKGTAAGTSDLNPTIYTGIKILSQSNINRDWQIEFNVIPINDGGGSENAVIGVTASSGNNRFEMYTKKENSNLYLYGIFGNDSNLGDISNKDVVLTKSNNTVTCTIDGTQVSTKAWDASNTSESDDLAINIGSMRNFHTFCGLINYIGFKWLS